MTRVSEKLLEQITALSKDGYSTINANNARLVFAHDPIDLQDLATKNYVDGYAGGGGGASIDYIYHVTKTTTADGYLENSEGETAELSVSVNSGDIVVLDFGTFSWHTEYRMEDIGCYPSFAIIASKNDFNTYTTVGDVYFVGYDTNTDIIFGNMKRFYTAITTNNVKFRIYSTWDTAVQGFTVHSQYPSFSALVLKN
jgi:hypothetical protein